MKKLISILLIFVLIFAGYHFFTGDYLANNDYIGGGGGGGNYDDTTNNSSSGGSSTTPITREILKIHSSYDNADYEEIMCFDFFNKENCDSYTGWEFVSQGTTIKYGTECIYTNYYAVINGYSCLLQINANGPTTEAEFFATDWLNFQFENSALGKTIYIFNYAIENTYYLENYGSAYFSSLLSPSNIDLTVTQAIDFLSGKGISTNKTINIEIDFNEFSDNAVCPVFKLSYLHELSSLEVDGITYNEFINFDFSSKNNNLSYEDFKYISNFAPTGNVHYIYSMKINNYLVYISLYNVCNHIGESQSSAIEDLNTFLKFDWENYDFSLGSNNRILIIDPDNTLDGKYYLNSSGEITSLEKYPANYYTQDIFPFKNVDELKNDSRNSYSFTLTKLDTIIYSIEESSTLSLRNAQQEEQSTTCLQVGNYQVCESYEEDDYGYEWGPMHWPEEEE